MNSPQNDLQRFHKAQGDGANGIYSQALRELKAGRKRSHWIWFVLPQLRGLGHSSMAELYGISGMEEARAYLADPQLRSRLEEVIAVVSEQLQLPKQSLRTLMGGDLDAAKTISSLTLFEAAGLQSAGFLLDQLGRRCGKTLSRLQG